MLMKKRGLAKKFLRSFLLLCLSVLFGIISATPALASEIREKNSRLNLLLITIDTLRTDRLSCYSQQHLKTSNIDSLANQGALFSRAFAHTVTTLPSHVNILLGTTPLYHGVHDNGNFFVRDELLSLAELLKGSGYATGAFVGGYPLDSRFGLVQGFDVYDDEYEVQSEQKGVYRERKAESVVNKALDWLKKQKDPWFLWIHCFDPHDPYEPPEPFKTEYNSRPYDGEVAYVDFALGRLLGDLKENDRFAKTVIILTADHGESLGEHGETTHGYLAYNPTLQIPLVICVPGAKPGRIEQVVGHTDIFPTVCDVLEIKKPTFLQGLSLLPLMKGKKLAKRFVYFESLYPYYSRGWAPLRGYLRGTEKFIDSPLPELYELSNDFDEKINIIEEKTLKLHREEITRLIQSQSSAKSAEAEQRLDKESLEKLRSLGYISSSQVQKKKAYGPDDDIKIMLAYHNRCIEAAKMGHAGKVREGIELVKAVIAEKKDIDIAYTTLANFYESEGRLADAVELLKAGLEILPSSYEILSSYINYLLKAGRFDDAIQAFSANNLPQAENDPDIWNELGIAYMEKGDYQKATDAFERALELDDTYPVVYKNLGTLQYSLFLKTRDSLSYKKALENFKKAIELDSKFAAAYNGLGAAYLSGGEFEGAIFCLEKALTLRPDYGIALYNLGLAYFGAGNMKQAYQKLSLFREKHSGMLSARALAELDALIKKCESGLRAG